LTRVVISATVRLYRESLAEVLARADGIDVVGSAARPEATIELVRALTPDVLVLDADIGVALVRTVHDAAPATRVVVLGIAAADGDVLSWAEAGIAGYVTRDESLDDLFGALRAAAAGDLVCSPQVAGLLLRRVRGLAAASAPPTLVLTGRETEIGRLLEQGLSNKEIAQTLHIELTTVKNHVHQILRKLGASRRGEAAALIRRAGLTA